MAGWLQSISRQRLKILSNFQLQRKLCRSIHDRQVSGTLRCPSSLWSVENTEFKKSLCSTNASQNDLFGLSSKLSYSTAGVLSSFWRNLGLKIQMRYPKIVLRRSSLRLYLCCVELVDHDLFFREFEMPDTFNSWFRITELHIWLCMVRLAQEGKEGTFIRNNLLNFMWQDIEKKSKKLSGSAGSASARREGIQALSEQFKAILYAYDEGLLSDDKALAGALWRNFFDRNCQNVEHLEKMVEYVRRQLFTINRLESNVVLTSGLMLFSPLYETPDALEREKQILGQIMKRW